MSVIGRRLDRIERTSPAFSLDAWLLRDVREWPDWALLSVLMGRPVSESEAIRLRDDPNADGEIEALLQEVARAADLSEIGRPAELSEAAAFSLAALRTRIASRIGAA